MAYDNASYAAGYRAGIKRSEVPLLDRELEHDWHTRKDTHYYKAGYKEGTQRALEDIKLYGENKLAHGNGFKEGFNEGLKGSNDKSVYEIAYKAGIKDGVGKAGHEVQYQAGYRAASRSAPKKSVEDTLTRLMDKVGTLGNHESARMAKHFIQKELEAINHKENKHELSL